MTRRTTGTSLPVPSPGLVIGYHYLWAADAGRGQQDAKARPCAVILAVEQRVETRAGEEVRIETVVVPITHAPPRRGDDPERFVALSPDVCQAAGLDEEPHWIVVSEYNRFVWPGFDLAPRRLGGATTFEYGRLPPGIFAEIRRKWLAIARAGRSGATLR